MTSAGFGSTFGSTIDLTRAIEPVTVESFERQRRAAQMLKLVLQGEQSYRRGDVLTDQDADRRFRAKLEALRTGG